MAATKRVAAINLGMQTVTMAVFELSPDGGIVLCGVAQAGLQPDPAADASRPDQIKMALSELRTKLDWKSGQSAFAVPSQGVFARFVRIPKVEPDQAAQMLFFEAQQNVPYPIEEVAWAYQILPEADPEQVGALILAAKLDQLESVAAVMQSVDLLPEFIETSPTALYNSFRYNYPDMPGCTLLVDIGARATNLIFAESERLFIRVLPVGGNAITAAIHKKFEDRPFAEIEQIKIRQALIPPPGHNDQVGEAAEIGKLARTVMTRIHNEIARSVTFYRTSQRGGQPVRVLLAGGGASLPYCLEFFNEKLSLPVEFFNPVRRVAVSAAVDQAALQTYSQALGECTGMAARLLLNEAPLELSLNSPLVEAAKRERGRRPFLVAAMLMLASIIGASVLHLEAAASRLEKLNTDLGAQISNLMNFKKQLDAAANQRKKLLADTSELVATPMLKTAWVSILDEIAQNVPPRNLWVTGLRPVSGGMELDPAKKDSPWGAPTPEDGSKPAVTAIALDGLYLENEKEAEVVDKFVDALAGSQLFQIESDKKTELVKLRTAQSGDTWAYQFKLLLPLKRPIPL